MSFSGTSTLFFPIRAVIILYIWVLYSFAHRRCYRLPNYVPFKHHNLYSKMFYLFIDQKESNNFQHFTICIKNANINIRWSFNVFIVIRFWVTQKSKINFVKNLLCKKIPVFLIFFFVFPDVFFKTIRNFLILITQSIN